MSLQSPQGADCRWYLQVAFSITLWSRANMDPQAQKSAINYLTGKKVQQYSKSRGPYLRITGLTPAYVIGRDIVISRDHLSLICHSPPLPLTPSFMLGCHCTSQLEERLNGSEPLVPFSGAFFLDH